MKTTIDIIKEISLNNKSIDRFVLVSFGKPRDIVKEYEWVESELSAFKAALSLRKEYGLPFWEALMITQLQEECSSERILRSSNHHNDITSVKELNASDFDGLYLETCNLGINSKVILDSGEVAHLPMIDFRVPFSDLGTKIVAIICSELRQNGYILSSGNSYHFIGSKPIPYLDFISFLGRALLYSPLVDTTWLGHQLIDGSATLRIGKKNGKLPVLVKVL